MKVLIVDDKEENTYLLEALLKGNGHDVEAVANGAEALERLKSGAFELIISDILMPVMDGFQLCRKVKGDEALHRIPFIIYTATYTGPQDEAFAIKIGADRFIQKPCEPEVFMGAVRDVTEAAGRRDIASTPAPVDEDEMLKLYSERLVRKLERKMLQLEKEIHARREAEEILRASELKYRLLADNTLDVIWTMDQNLTFTYVNPAIQGLMGYSPGEWIGSPFSEHCEEEDYAKMVRAIADETAKGPDGTGVIVEALLLNKNGEPIPFEIYGKVNYDKKGEPAGLQGVAREISERKRAEEALKKSEEKYRLLIENASEVVLVAQDGRVEFINCRVLEVLGYKPEELIGTSFVDYIHPEDRETVAEQHVKRLKGEDVPRVYSFRVIEKAGGTKWAQVSAIRIDWKGKLATLNFLTDITERKEAEQALREAYDIINSSSSVAFTWKNQEGWPVEFVSENVERLLGYTAEEFMKGKVSYAVCVHPADRQRVAKEVAELSKNQETTEFTHEPYRVIARDGSEKIVNDWTYVVRDNDGRVLHYKGIVEDITERKQIEEERKRLEAQLRQAQKMEALGTLAGGIAHDFNNILSAIMGYTHLSMETAPKGSSLRTNLREVLSATMRATELVKQILTFSRQTEMEEQPVRVELVAKEALKLLRASLPTTIEIDRDIQSGALVLADPSQIHQVVMNLCVNAGHAMGGKGGILQVDVTDVDLDDHFTDQHPGISPGPHVKLTVSDTGHGMDASTMERIFEPYFTTKSKGEGTGLGLSVVHGIATDCGGTITVCSEPGKGTTFCVYLPAVEMERQPEADVEKVLPKGAERILFVDDEPMLATLGKIVLEGLGYQVVTRTSPVEALEAFRAAPDRFDLVVTDMTMPVMTGVTLAGGLRKIRPDLPVIVCTGFSTKITKEKAATMGIADLLMKPLLKPALAKAVRKALDQEEFKD